MTDTDYYLYIQKTKGYAPNTIDSKTSAEMKTLIDELINTPVDTKYTDMVLGVFHKLKAINASNVHTGTMESHTGGDLVKSRKWACYPKAEEYTKKEVYENICTWIDDGKGKQDCTVYLVSEEFLLCLNDDADYVAAQISQLCVPGLYKDDAKIPVVKLNAFGPPGDQITENKMLLSIYNEYVRVRNELQTMLSEHYTMLSNKTMGSEPKRYAHRARVRNINTAQNEMNDIILKVVDIVHTS
jgi:hypothetical protein